MCATMIKRILAGWFVEAMDLIDGGHVHVNQLYKTKWAAAETALHVAVRINCVRMVKLLLQRYADANVVNECGETPLYLAMQNVKPTRMARLLLHAGATARLNDTVRGCVPLRLLLSQQRNWTMNVPNRGAEQTMACVELLLVHGARCGDAETDNLLARTIVPMLICAGSGRYKPSRQRRKAAAVFRLILAAGFDPNSQIGCSSAKAPIFNCAATHFNIPVLCSIAACKDHAKPGFWKSLMHFISRYFGDDQVYQGLEQAQHEMAQLSATSRWRGLLRPRLFALCSALASLNLAALELLLIFDALESRSGALDASLHVKWRVICAVKETFAALQR